jgi:hypothetical protein
MKTQPQTLLVDWRDKDIGIDVIPLSLFVPGNKKRAFHGIVWHGREYPAWCERTIENTQAMFNYGAGKDVRELASLNEQHCEIGIMRFSYPSLERLDQAKVYWNGRLQRQVKVTVALRSPHKQSQKRRGPPPQHENEYHTRRSSKPTWTYLMRFGSEPIWKVGISSAPCARRDQLNFSVPVEHLGIQWEVFDTVRWDTGEQAYRMEQRILDRFESMNERVCCDAEVIDKIWGECAPPPSERN